MDRKLFIEKLDRAEHTVDVQYVLDVAEKAIDFVSSTNDSNPRGHNELIIIMEDLATLTGEISKELRGRGDKLSLLSKLGDVQIDIYCVLSICGITTSDLSKTVNVKIQNLVETLEDTGEFK